MIIACCSVFVARRNIQNANPYDLFDDNHTTNSLDSFIVAQNDKYSMNWDNEKKRVFLTDKVSGEIWSNLPDELFEEHYDEDHDPIVNNPQLETPLMIEYYDAKTLKSKKVNAYTASLKKSDYSIVQIENGIEITYYFDNIKISIPVQYVLKDNHIVVSIETSKITEKNNQVRKISLMPFMCSVRNCEKGYLFVPSGSGALIFADSEKEVSAYYNAPVYGDDLERYPESRLQISNQEKVKLPVFGAADTDGKGAMGIITSGAESANITANCNNQKLGYSAVAVEFVIRDYQNATANVNTGKWETQVYSDLPIKSTLSVDYYPLYGSDNNYVSMARIYRDYLMKKYGMTPTKEESMLNLKILGGVKVKKTFLGIPYSKMFVATSISQAQDIVEQLNSKSFSTKVNMVGFGDAGLQVEKIAGGYKINSAFGSSEDLSRFSKWCKNENIDLFMTFDLISYGKSGSGLSNFIEMDSALGVNLRSTTQYDYHFGNKAVRTDSYSYSLVKRALIPRIADKVTTTTEKFGLSGMGLDLISSSKYSDYRDQKYFCSGGYASDISEIIKKMKTNGNNVLVSSANDFAAVCSDCIQDAPTTSNKESLFTYDIPFYSMVFKGYIPMTTTSVNLSLDSNNLLLQAAETGMGLLFTVSKEYTSDLHGISPDVFYSSSFDDLYDNIKEYSTSYNEYFELIKNASILEHEVLDNGLRKTTFSSGVTVFVNYTESELLSPIGAVNAKSYIYSTSVNLN